MNGIKPEKKLVKPSSGVAGRGGGTTATPVRNVERAGAGGSRTGGITNRNLRTRPYKPMTEYEGAREKQAKRFGGTSISKPPVSTQPSYGTPSRFNRQALRPMMGQIPQPQLSIQPSVGYTTQQPIQGQNVVQPPMQATMPPMVAPQPSIYQQSPMMGSPMMPQFQYQPSIYSMPFYRGY